MGPSLHASLGEILLAVFFVLLVFAMFIFAFGAPILSYIVTVKERWPEYSGRKKLSTLGWTALTLGVFTLLTFWAISPFAKA